MTLEESLARAVQTERDLAPFLANPDRDIRHDAMGHFTAVSGLIEFVIEGLTDARYLDMAVNSASSFLDKVNSKKPNT